MRATLNQLDSSLGSNHKRGNTKKRADCGDAKDQIEQHQASDEKEESVCDIKSTEERHDKVVETKGESYKNIVISTAKTKIEICYK